MRGRAASLAVVLVAASWLVRCKGETFTADEPNDAGAGADGANDVASTDAALVDATPAPDASAIPACRSVGYPANGCNDAKTCTNQPIYTPAVDAGNDMYPFGMAVDATHLYWVAQTDRNGGGNGAGYVNRVPKGGGARERVTPLLDWPTALGVDEQSVYVSHAEVSRVGIQVDRFAKNCGGVCSPELVMGNLHFGALFVHKTSDLFFVDDQAVWHAVFDGSSWAPTKMRDSSAYPSMATDHESVFWASGFQPVIRRVDIDSGLDTMLGTFANDAGGGQIVDADCDAVYALSAQHLWRFDKDANRRAPKDLGFTPAGMYSHTADAHFVYLGFADGGGIVRVAKDGSKPPEQMLGSGGDIWSLTTDGTTLYWGDHAGGRVVAIGK